MLLDEGANLNILDPKVEEDQIYLELSNSQFNLPIDKIKKKTKIFTENALEACRSSHAIVVCTEWDIFRVCRFFILKFNRNIHIKLKSVKQFVELAQVTISQFRGSYIDIASYK